jgi:hypothetical protein
MRQLTTSELLQIWEDCFEQPVLHKALRLLSKACDIPFDKATELSIGERDVRLLILREWLFGNKMNNTAHCPKCAERVEWEMDTFDLHLQTPQSVTQIPLLELNIETYHLRFRLPNSADMLNSTLVPSNPKAVLFNCIVEAKSDQKDLPINDLPNTVFETLMEKMAQEDPQANITILLNCPVCQHQWASVFDILSYFWIEIDHWAKHILQEVYVLARAFSWSERDIVNMSVRRRQMYIDMLRT